MSTIAEVAPLIYTEPRRCAWGMPGCESKAGYGIFANFCQAHADELKRIRESLDDEMKRRGRYGQRIDQRQRNGGRILGSTCCNIGCWNPRDPSSSFCSDCLDAGAKDD